MKTACLLWLLPVGCVLGFGQDATKSLDVTKTLHGIEERYNNSKTLRVNFTETLITQGGRHRPEMGTLYLRKPGLMRWEYSSPAGDVFVSDGKFTYEYAAKSNSYKRERLKEGDDMRGPLAFLLGKLDFNRDFDKFLAGGADGAITAVPKNDKLEYSEVTLTPAPDSSLKGLSIKGQDGSITQFVFDGEQRNPPLADALFKFVPPPGAVLTESTRGNE